MSDNYEAQAKAQDFINEFNQKQRIADLFSRYNTIYNKRQNMKPQDMTLISSINPTTGIDCIFDLCQELLKSIKLTDIINDSAIGTIDAFNKAMVYEIIYFLINFNADKYRSLMESYFPKICNMLEQLINNFWQFTNDYFAYANTSNMINAVSTDNFTITHSRIAYVVTKLLTLMPISPATFNALKWRNLLHMISADNFENCDGLLFYLA